MNFTKPWDNGKLQVCDNHRYLVNGATPFFWMGDTAWLLFQKLTLEETEIYMRNRKEKGFNIILVDFLHDSKQSNIYGKPALVDGDFMRPDMEGGYWNHVDQVIRMAEAMGLYMGILPIWGSSIVKSGALNMGNVDSYCNFLMSRYKRYPNIVWIMGGDVRGDVNEELFNWMGEFFKKNDPDKLVGYHPFGRTSSSAWFHSREWLDFNMFQSGHRRYDQASLGAWDDNAVKEEFYGEDNWRYVVRDYGMNHPKPTVDGEPSYEHILQGLHDETQPYWQAADVRRYAYWPVFAGAFGHTYGDNSIMQFYRDTSKKGAFGVKDTWDNALHHPGSSHMTHLYQLMTSVDFIHGHAADELLVGAQGERYDRIVIFAGEDYLMAYDYSGRPFAVDLGGFTGKTMEMYWFDPATGVYSFVKEIKDLDTLEAVPPKKDVDTDYVLVLRSK